MVFADLPIRGILIAAAIGVLVTLGYSAVSNSLAGTPTATAVTRPSKAPVVVAIAPTPAPSSEAPRTPTPSAPRPTEPVATPQGGWFWVEDVTVSDEGGSTEPHDLAIEVTSARFGVLTASTASGATCGASGAYPSGAPIVNNGLGQTSADSSGFVRWRFAASPAERGRASYVFTCSSGSNRRTLKVLFDIP